MAGKITNFFARLIHLQTLVSGPGNVTEELVDNKLSGRLVRGRYNISTPALIFIACIIVVFLAALFAALYYSTQ